MPIITAWATLFCGLLFIALTWQVIRSRRSSGIAMGAGDDAILLRRMRGQANAAEQMPITLLAILAAELVGGSTLILGLIALIFCAGRAAHGYGFGWLEHNMPLRFGGMATSLSGTGLAMVYLFIVLITGT